MLAIWATTSPELWQRPFARTWVGDFLHIVLEHHSWRLPQTAATPVPKGSGSRPILPCRIKRSDEVPKAWLANAWDLVGSGYNARADSVQQGQSFRADRFPKADDPGKSPEKRTHPPYPCLRLEQADTFGGVTNESPGELDCYPRYRHVQQRRPQVVPHAIRKDPAVSAADRGDTVMNQDRGEEKNSPAGVPHAQGIFVLFTVIVVEITITTDPGNDR